jgi:amino acid permease
MDYWARKLVLVCGGAVMIPCVLLRTMREVSFLSIFGMSASVIAVIVCIVFSISHRVDHPDVKYTDINYSLFPSAFAAITLSFAGHSTIPSIEKHSASPQSFQGVINVAYIILLALYLPTAIFGYLAFGDDVTSPVLCKFPQSNVVVTITKVIVAIHCIAAYPVLMNVVFQELDDNFSAIREMLPVRVVVRVLIVSTTAMVAYFVPYFAAFMTLIGAACISMMVFVFPIVFNLKLRGHLLPWWEKVFGFFVMVVGLTGGSIGAYQAIRDINHLVTSHASPNA